MNYQVVTKTVSAQSIAAVRRRVLPRDIGRTWKSPLDLVWGFSIFGLILLVGATHVLAQTADTRILWKFETGG